MGWYHLWEKSPKGYPHPHVTDDGAERRSVCHRGRWEDGASPQSLRVTYKRGATDTHVAPVYSIIQATSAIWGLSWFHTQFRIVFVSICEKWHWIFLEYHFKFNSYFS